MSTSAEAADVIIRFKAMGGAAMEREIDKMAGKIGAVEDAVNANAGAAEAESGGLPAYFATAGKHADQLAAKLDSLSNKSMQIARSTAPASAVAGFSILETVKKYTEAEGAFRMLETQAWASHRQREEMERDSGQYAKYGAGPQAVAESYYPLFSVLKDVTKANEGMRASAEGAAIGHDSQLHAAEALASFWKDRGAKSGVSSLAEEMNLLDQTVGAGKMHLPTLNEVTNTRLLQVAGVHDISQRAILGMLAGVSKGVGEGGVNSMASVFRTAIAKAGGLKGEALLDAKKLGLSEFQLTNDMREGDTGLITMLRDLGKNEKSLGQDTWEKYVNGIFGGARSASSVLTALQALPDIEQITRGLTKQHGAHSLHEHYAGTAQTAEQKKAVMHAELENTEFQLGKVFAPATIATMKETFTLLGAFTGWLEKLPKPLKDLFTGTVIAAAALAPTAAFAGGILKLGSIALKVGKWFGTLDIIQTRVLPGLGLLWEKMTTTADAGLQPLQAAAEEASGQLTLFGEEAVAAGAEADASMGAGGALGLLGRGGMLAGAAKFLGGAGLIYGAGELASQGLFGKSLFTTVPKGYENLFHDIFGGGSSKHQATKSDEERINKRMLRESEEGLFHGRPITLRVDSHLHIDGKEAAKAIQPHIDWKSATREVERQQRSHEARR